MKTQESARRKKNKVDAHSRRPSLVFRLWGSWLLAHEQQLQMVLTPMRLQVLIAYYHQLMNTSQIAEKYSLSKSRVQQLLDSAERTILVQLSQYIGLAIGAEKDKKALLSEIHYLELELRDQDFWIKLNQLTPPAVV